MPVGLRFFADISLVIAGEQSPSIDLQTMKEIPIGSKRWLRLVIYIFINTCMTLYLSALFWGNGYYTASTGVTLLMAIYTWIMGVSMNRQLKSYPLKVKISPGPGISGMRGLVLCGGGGKGAYQLGALRAFEECGMRFKVVAGASVGALNAALYYALGLRTAREIFFANVAKILRYKWSTPIIALVRLYGSSSRHICVNPKMRLRIAIGSLLISIGLFVMVPGDSVFVPNIWAWGGYTVTAFVFFAYAPIYLSMSLWLIAEHWEWASFSRRSLYNLIKSRIDNASIASIGTQLYVCVSRQTDQQTPEHMVEWPERLYQPRYVEITSGTCDSTGWLLASASIPFGVFPGVNIGCATYVDGGIADNAPILPVLEAGCDEIFVIHTNARAYANGEILSNSEGLAAHIARCRLLRDYITPDGITTTSGTSIKAVHYTARLTHIIPSRPTGSLIGSLFLRARSSAERLEMLGYEDTKRVLSVYAMPQSAIQ